MNSQAEAIAPFQSRGGGAFSPLLQPDVASGPRERQEPVAAAKVDARLELPLEELSFHRLTTPAEIAKILHLRGEIQLPASALADPAFRTREKKETSTVSWALSCAKGPTSER